MQKTICHETFVALLTVNPESEQSHRIVLLNKYINGDIDKEIKVLDHAIFPSMGVSCIIIAKAPSKQYFEKAFTPCANIYYVEIYIATHIDIFAQATAFRYGVIAWEDAIAKHLTRNPTNLLAEIQLQTKVYLTNGNQTGAILLLTAPSVSHARWYGEYLFPSSHVISREAFLPSNFLAEKQTTSLTTKASVTTKETAAPILAASPIIVAAGEPMTIYNDDDLPNNAIHAEDANGKPFIYHDIVLSGGWRVTKQTTPFVSQLSVYIFPSLPGTLSYHFKYWVQRTTLNGQHYADNRDIAQSLTSNAPPPALYIPYSPGAKLWYTVQNGKPRYYSKSDLYDWLHRLFHTTDFDQDAPEKGYVPDSDEYLAYQYILDNISGRTPPSSGRVPGYKLDNITRPVNAKFSQDAFDNVIAHLKDECGNIGVAWQWFGIGNVFYSINATIANVALADLVGAAGLMSIEPEKTDITIILDEVFGVLAAVVAVIPEVGAALSALIVIGWESTKQGMQQGEATNPINKSVSNMADTLNAYLANVLDATANNYDTLRNNWGKLQEFVNGTITDKIKPEDFRTSLPPLENFGTSSTSKTTVPTDYLTAAAKAWKIIIYQTLFATVHTPTVNLSHVGNPPANPWNPDAGIYEYIYYLECKYIDGSGNTNQGFLQYDCTTTAPKEVMEILFGTKSQLDLNPLEFYIGLNGWPPIMPVNDVGHIGYYPPNGQVPFPEIGTGVK